MLWGGRAGAQLHVRLDPASVLHDLEHRLQLLLRLLLVFLLFGHQRPKAVVLDKFRGIQFWRLLFRAIL